METSFKPDRDEVQELMNTLVNELKFYRQGKD